MKRLFSVCLGTAGLALLMGAPAWVHAQDQTQDSLTLFEPVETEQQAPRPDPRPRRNTPEAAAEPEFTLVGTSRIGSSHRATLRTRGGEILVVAGQPGSAVQIPGYNGYRLTELGSREVSIAFPGSSPCIEYHDKGVSCASGNVASLSLVPAEPVALADDSQRRPGLRTLESTAEDVQEAAEQEPANLFAAALRAAANESPEDAANRRAEAQRFQMRRIDPSQVPPGQRLVRTPFGDRLIDQ